MNKMLIVTFLLLTKMKLPPEGEVRFIKHYKPAKGQNEPRMEIKLNVHMTLFSYPLSFSAELFISSGNSLKCWLIVIVKQSTKV